MMEYILGSNCKGNCGLSRSIHNPDPVRGGTLNPDAKMPPRLAFHSLPKMNAANHMKQFDGFTVGKLQHAASVR